MTVTFTDLFCGAGGSSLGVERAGGELVMAANHNPNAVNVHQVWFPNARHDLADISKVDPRRYPRTDILVAGPECTNHTSAKGVSRKHQYVDVDLEAERSRATMWCPHQFTEVHRYAAVLLENVIDVCSWRYWRSWCMAWDDAGYDLQVLNINSAHTGEISQWRDRVYMVAYRRGIKLPKLEFRPPCWCYECKEVVPGIQRFRNPNTIAGRWRRPARPGSRSKDGRGPGHYDYRCPQCDQIAEPPAPPAVNVIDFSIPCPKIKDRRHPKSGKPHPVSAKQRHRIQTGIDLYGMTLIAEKGQTYERPGSGYVRAWPLAQPLPTQTTDPQHAIAYADSALVVPFQKHCIAYPTRFPLSTIRAGGGSHGIIMANQSGGSPFPSTDPMPTVTTRGASLFTELHDSLDIDECWYRSLTANESGRGMGFPDGYVPDTYTEEVKQLLYGNGVTPPVKTHLAAPLIAALEAAA